MNLPRVVEVVPRDGGGRVTTVKREIVERALVGGVWWIDAGGVGPFKLADQSLNPRWSDQAVDALLGRLRAEHAEALAAREAEAEQRGYERGLSESRKK